MMEERVLKVYPSHSLTELRDVPVQMFNDIARAQLKIRQNPERTAELGNLATHFRLVEDPAEADIHLLPLLWNWYLESSHMGMVGEAAEQGKQWGKPVVLFSAGDYTANVPFSGLTIFQPCAYRSRRFENGNRVFALPAFISDFVKLYCDGQLPLRSKGPKPVVGFCGLAGGGLHRYAYRQLKLQFDRLAYWIGIRKWEPPPFEPTLFRRRILEQLRRSPDIVCNLSFGIGIGPAIARRKRTPSTPPAWSMCRTCSSRITLSACVEGATSRCGSMRHSVWGGFPSLWIRIACCHMIMSCTIGIFWSSWTLTCSKGLGNR